LTQAAIPGESFPMCSAAGMVCLVVSGGLSITGGTTGSPCNPLRDQVCAVCTRFKAALSFLNLLIDQDVLGFE
jgi:hypothetical protein